ncbi:nucleoside hydrolase [Pseudonocardia sp. HH130629-09]|uniref:nucleoside hydrolase n=1 Tax=Pseudonocardia sp. HH130629-09 TaxID=1641402 RepID=UPI0009E75099|nr:nucleoside hydrolase [Pseudonocardia sp. HH130629-09]
MIDTDPGVDDAIALLLALGSSALRVAGVTTVAGNAGIEQVTANATAVLDLAGAPADLPVAMGAAGPLAGGPRVPDEPVHGPGALGGVVLPPGTRLVAGTPATGGHGPDGRADGTAAVDLIARVARTHPGELVLLALGPLTNVARLLERDPEAAGMLAGVVHMGGAAFAPGNVTPAAEFNTYCDPEATRVVLTSGLPVRLVPLDVTRRHGVRECRVHDATAVVALLDPERFCWRRHPVDVECVGELTRGALVTDVYGRTGRPATVELALDLDPDPVRHRLLAVLEDAR